MRTKLLLIFFLTVYTGVVWSQDEENGESKQEAKEPKAESSITSHQVRIDGNTVRYTAVAGTIILKDDDGEPLATFGYTAYLKDGVSDLADRPIMFAYNGGPGSSSIWLHMGVLGPVIVKTEDAGFTGPPFERVAKEYSNIDPSALVLSDAVSPGHSPHSGAR